MSTQSNNSSATNSTINETPINKMMMLGAFIQGGIRVTSTTLHFLGFAAAVVETATIKSVQKVTPKILAENVHTRSLRAGFDLSEDISNYQLEVLNRAAKTFEIKL